MGALRSAGLLASLVLAPHATLGVPVDSSQSHITVSDVEWAPGYSFTLPPILKRDDKETAQPICDWTCMHRVLFQTAFSAASSGIEYAMVTYNAQSFCFDRETAWCPQIVESETNYIASRSSYMNIDYDACDNAVLLTSMQEVSRRGAMYGMQWAEQIFAGEALGADQAEVEKLQWSMWYLSQASAGFNIGALPSDHNKPLRSWNATSVPDNSILSGSNSTSSGSNSTNGIAKSSSGLQSFHPATNLLAPFLYGGTCTDPYLCEESTKDYISGLLKGASSAINGTTWFGFMIATGGASNRPDGPERKPTFPTWTNEPPCTGCPPPPHVDEPQRPPPNWTPENIPNPPSNPNAPEPPQPPREPLEPEVPDPDPEEEENEEDRKERLEREERSKKDRQEVAEECKDDALCRERALKKKVEQHEVEDERNAEDREIEERCQREKQCMAEERRKLDDEKKAQEERDRREAELRRQKSDDRIKAACGPDKHCIDVEWLNEEARIELERLAEENRKRLKAEGKGCRKKPCPPNPHANVNPPRPRPPTEIKHNTRFMSTLYDPESSSMRTGELTFHPTGKDTRFIEGGDLPWSQDRINNLVHNKYECFKMKGSGKKVWLRFTDVTQMDDPSWIRAGNHMFKAANGQIARNPLGDPVIGGPPGSPPLDARPVLGRRVDFNGQTNYRLYDSVGGSVIDEGDDRDTFDIVNNRRISEQMDWEKVNAGRRRLDELHNDLDIADSRWAPVQRPIPHEEHRPGKLGGDRLRAFESGHDNGEPDPPGGRHNKPGRLNPKQWPPPNTDGADDWDLLDDEDIEKLKKGEKGKLPRAGKYPKVAGFGGITSIARWTQKTSAALTPTGPIGWLVMFGTMGAAEFLMFSQAEGNADVWWHCVKQRVNIAGVHVCGMVDENGNEIMGEDEGPFMNFLRNYYGWLIPEDIDGDGHLENPFDKFVAGMQNLGENIYDFFDSSEDGTGVVENTWTITKNGFKTIVHVAGNGVKWVEKKVEQGVEWAKDKWHKVKGWMSSKWHKWFGDDDDDD